MADLDVRDEQTKYCTKITQYKYSRLSPGSATTRDREGTYTLPLPIAIPADQYGVVLQSQDLGEIGTTADMIREGVGNASIADKIGAAGTAFAVGAGMAALFTSLLRRGGSSITDAATGVLAAGAAAYATGAPYAGAYGGIARNPHTAMLFERTAMRSFNLVWRFSPRTEAQSRRISQLIATLRQEMLPSYAALAGTTTRFALQYPKLFRVDFLNLDHVGYPKIDYSFLENFTVSTADRNGNVFYRNGYPAFVEIQMQFAEIDMKTREFYTGYGPTTGANSTQPATTAPSSGQDTVVPF